MKTIAYLSRFTTAKSLACLAGERASNVVGALLSVDGGLKITV